MGERQRRRRREEEGEGGREGQGEKGEEGRRRRGKRRGGEEGEELSPLHWVSVQPVFDDSLSERLEEGAGQGPPRTYAVTQKAEATGANRMAVSESDPFLLCEKEKVRGRLPSLPRERRLLRANLPTSNLLLKKSCEERQCRFCAKY